MNTDDLRTKYGKVIHFNCKDGDEAFTDGYVLWLEKQLLLYDVVFNEACEVDLDVVVKFPFKHTTTYTLKKKESEVELCDHKWVKVDDEESTIEYCEKCWLSRN